MAAIEYRGLNAVTNFDLSRYIKWLRPDTDNSNTSTHNINPNPKIEISTSNTLPPLITPNDHHHHHTTTTHELETPDHFLHYYHKQQPVPLTTGTITTTLTPPQPTSATSALGLLLQSSKFKEMMEMTTAAEYPVSSTSTTPHESEPSGCKFPDDMNTFFEAHDFSAYAGGDDFIFGDINSFMQPMLHGDHF